MFSSLFRSLIQSFSWLVIVAPWEQAIRVRLGKHISSHTAGTVLRIPFIDKIYKQSTRRRLSIIRAQTLTTKDRHTVTCTGAIGFSVLDLHKLFNTMESPNDTIENEVATLISAHVCSNDLKDVTSATMSKYVMSMLDLTKYGLTGQEFYITSFATVKTYRFITGDMASWSHDSRMHMNEDRADSSAHIPY